MLDNQQPMLSEIFMQSIETLSPLDQANLQEAARLQGFWTHKGYVGMLMRKV